MCHLSKSLILQQNIHLCHKELLKKTNVLFLTTYCYCTVLESVGNLMPYSTPQLSELDRQAHGS